MSLLTIVSIKLFIFKIILKEYELHNVLNPYYNV